MHRTLTQLVGLLLFFFFGLQATQAQLIVGDEIIEINDEEGYVNLSSPYTTALTFFYNLREDNFNPDLAARTLRGYSGMSEAQRLDLVLKLKQIFDGNGVLVRLQEVPREVDFQEENQGNQPRYFFNAQILPLVYLELKEDRWQFSSFTVNRIPDLHKETFPFGTDRLLNLLPEIGTDSYFGLHLWQLVGLFGLILLLFLAHKIMTVVLDRGFLYTLQYFGYGNIAEKYLLPVARVISIYIIVELTLLFIRVLQLPIEVLSWLILILNAAKPFIITVVFYKIVDIVSAYFQRLAEKTASTLDDQLVPLLRKTLKAFVVLVGTLFILKQGLRVDIVPFLTGLSIGGLAFALAAQDTIKNFFGSVMIFIDKPFQVGDWITSGDVDGTVEEVGFRSTRVRTFRNSLVYIPNGKIADATIDNHGLRRYRRFYTKLTITYDTPPELIEEFVQGLREIVRQHPDTWKDNYHVYFNDLNAYSQDIMFYIFFQVPTWGEELRARHEVLIQVVRLANHLGVRFAFPTQTLHMESFPEKKTLVPEYAQSAKDYQEATARFFGREPNGDPRN
ncbi:MAG: mechanosensitive ion channel family protein [Nitritalea sp.]